MVDTKSGLKVGGAFALIVIVGTSSFYIGQLTEKVGHQKQTIAALELRHSLVKSEPFEQIPNIQERLPLPAPVKTSHQVELQPSISSDGVPTGISSVLSDVDSASGILNALSKAQAISASGDVSHEQPIYAFFDPRCPYCKAAMAELSGRAAVSWIPVALLGDFKTGSNIIEAMKTVGGKEAVSMVVDGKIPAAVGSQDTAGQLKDNASILFALYEGAQESIAVPTILVPRRDGTVTFHRGFNTGDGETIVEEYGS